MEEEEEELEESELEDIALLTKRYKKYSRFKKGNNSKKNFKGSTSKEKKGNEDTITCFDCKKLGHMKHECPHEKKSEEKGNESYMG